MRLKRRVIYIIRRIIRSQDGKTGKKKRKGSQSREREGWWLWGTGRKEDVMDCGGDVRRRKLQWLVPADSTAAYVMN